MILENQLLKRTGREQIRLLASRYLWTSPPGRKVSTSRITDPVLFQRPHSRRCPAMRLGIEMAEFRYLAFWGGSVPVKPDNSRRFLSYASLPLRSNLSLRSSGVMRLGARVARIYDKISKKKPFARILYIQFPAFSRHTRPRMRQVARGYDLFFRRAPETKRRRSRTAVHRASPPGLAPARGGAGPSGGGGRAPGERSSPSRPPTARRLTRSRHPIHRRTPSSPISQALAWRMIDTRSGATNPREGASSCPCPPGRRAGAGASARPPRAGRSGRCGPRGTNSSSARGSRFPIAGFNCGAKTSSGERCCAGECSRPGAGRTDSIHPERETACPTRIRLFDARENANATGGGRPSAARGACAPGAANILPRPGEASARTASREDASPNKPDTPEPNQRVLDMAGGIPRAAGAWRGRGTGGEGANDARRASVRCADGRRPSKGARSARPAAKIAGRPRGSSTPKGAPGGDADGAGRKSSTTLLLALRAPQGIQGAVRERTPRAGCGTPTGGPGRFAWTAPNRRTEPRDASVAPADRISPRASTRECPSIRRATPWLNSPRAPSTVLGTPGKKSPCASPSKGSPGKKSRSCQTSLSCRA